MHSLTRFKPINNRERGWLTRYIWPLYALSPHLFELSIKLFKKRCKQRLAEANFPVNITELLTRVMQLSEQDLLCYLHKEVDEEIRWLLLYDLYRIITEPPATMVPYYTHDVIDAMIALKVTDMGGLQVWRQYLLAEQFAEYSVLITPVSGLTAGQGLEVYFSGDNAFPLLNEIIISLAEKKKAKILLPYQGDNQFWYLYEIRIYQRVSAYDITCFKHGVAAQNDLDLNEKNFFAMVFSSFFPMPCTYIFAESQFQQPSQDLEDINSSVILLRNLNRCSYIPKFLGTTIPAS